MLNDNGGVWDGSSEPSTTEPTPSSGGGNNVFTTLLGKAADVYLTTQRAKAQTRAAPSGAQQATSFNPLFNWSPYPQADGKQVAQQPQSIFGFNPIFVIGALIVFIIGALVLRGR